MILIHRPDARMIHCPMVQSETQPVCVGGWWSTEQNHSGAIPERTANQWNARMRQQDDVCFKAWIHIIFYPETLQVLHGALSGIK